MKISEIKNKKLRALAELRRDERDRDSPYYCGFSDVLFTAFPWSISEEGDKFWRGVDKGEITKIPKNKEKIDSKSRTEETPKGLITYGRINESTCLNEASLVSKTYTKECIENAFKKWEKDYRLNPSKFKSTEEESALDLEESAKSKTELLINYIK